MEHWTRGDDWKRFKHQHSMAFENELHGFEMPDYGTTVANRLTFLLDRAVGEPGKRRPVKDILLYFHPLGTSVPKRIEPSWFHILPMEYTMIPGSEFFELLH